MGAYALQPACATPVWDGMEITTDSEKVKESVRGVLALMQANHPAECMTCDMNGRCEFQVGWHLLALALRGVLRALDRSMACRTG
jgi:predicted molibdopterin-dependent oxidoreductase YjgC